MSGWYGYSSKHLGYFSKILNWNEIFFPCWPSCIIDVECSYVILHNVCLGNIMHQKEIWGNILLNTFLPTVIEMYLNTVTNPLSWWYMFKVFSSCQSALLQSNACITTHKWNMTDCRTKRLATLLYGHRKPNGNIYMFEFVNPLNKRNKKVCFVINMFVLAAIILEERTWEFKYNEFLQKIIDKMVDYKLWCISKMTCFKTCNPISNLFSLCWLFS